MTVRTGQPSEPKPRRRSRRLLVFVSVVLAALSASVAVHPGAARAISHRHLSREQALAIAKRLTGYPEAEVARAERRLLHRRALPSGPRKRRLAWVITLQGVTLSSSWGPYRRPNHFIKGLKVLLDAHTGSLLRIDPLPPVAGSLKHFTDSKLEEDLRGASLPPPSVKLAFAQALRPTMVERAKHVSAYLVTHDGPNGPSRYWYIVLGGLRVHVTQSDPKLVSTEALYIIDAARSDQGGPAGAYFESFWP